MEEGRIGVVNGPTNLHLCWVVFVLFSSIPKICSFGFTVLFLKLEIKLNASGTERLKNNLCLMSTITYLLLWPGTRLAGPKSQQAESEGARTQSDGALRGRVVSAGCYCLPGQSYSLSAIYIESTRF